MRITITNGRENPGKVYAGAAAREKKIVVELILLGGWSKDCCSLDGEDNSGVIRRAKNVSSKAFLIIFPAEWEALLMNSV